jgi:geranylgeranylglycerol-phosphate geranylgeranyltransferase
MASEQEGNGPSAPALFTRAKAIVAVTRPELTIASGLCVVTGEFLALEHLPSLTEGFMGFLAGFSLSASAMTSNDYYDLEVDRVNNPGRPLPSGRITLTELVLLTIFLTIVGLVAAAFLGPFVLLFAIGTWSIGLLYNWKLKESGPLGNALVSLSVALAFLFGGLIVGGLDRGMVWVFAVLSFLFNMSEETAGGVMDMEGDGARLTRSLARVRGREYALLISGLWMLLFILISFVPYLLGWLGAYYLGMILVADAMVAFFFLKLAWSTTSEEGRRRMKQLYVTLTSFILAFMFTPVFA